MSYQVGISGGFGRIGIAPREPRLFCDGCGRDARFLNRHGMPKQWFLDKKPPPGWKKTMDGEHQRDWCPDCKEGK